MRHYIDSARHAAIHKVVLYEILFFGVVYSVPYSGLSPYCLGSRGKRNVIVTMQSYASYCLDAVKTSSTALLCFCVRLLVEDATYHGC